MEEALIQIMNVSSFQQLMNASVRDINGYSLLLFKVTYHQRQQCCHYHLPQGPLYSRMSRTHSDQLECW